MAEIMGLLGSVEISGQVITVDQKLVLLTL